MTKIETHWEEIFGTLSKELSLFLVKDGVLFIETTNPMWVTEIEFYKSDLLNKIRGVLSGKKSINSLKISTIPVLKKTIIKPSKTPLKARSFEEKIKVLNQEREAEGQQLCTTCNEVYTHSDICIYCHAKIAKDQPESPRI